MIDIRRTKSLLYVVCEGEGLGTREEEKEAKMCRLLSISFFLFVLSKMIVKMFLG